MRRGFVTFGMLTLIVVWAVPALGQTGPRETVEAANQQIQALVSKRVPDGSAAAKARDNSLRDIVTNLLDLDYMAEKALGREWRNRSESERTEYLSLMRQLVERSYLRQARERADYQVQFGAVNVDGDTAEVETNLRIKTRGRIETVEVFYTMKQRGGVWRVTDIETDGASTVRNYRAQFRRIIQQNGFGELISRMRRRLEAGASEL